VTCVFTAGDTCTSNPGVLRPTGSQETRYVSTDEVILSGAERQLKVFIQVRACLVVLPSVLELVAEGQNLVARATICGVVLCALLNGWAAYPSSSSSLASLPGGAVG
jgi:hypothetical protein